MKRIIPNKGVEYAIDIIHGQRVMLDEDLAKINGVETRILNQAIRRNRGRFPDDFMFLKRPRFFQATPWEQRKLLRGRF
ncbi:hypothetical protein GF366_02180 [Candidatus Peregrinibacteria bacterium]|nr:hypothetical protein [Candidatus Peregrinibacteria bacterium]